MSFEWNTGLRDAQTSGTPGVFVILADISGSMTKQWGALKSAMNATRSAYPKARAFLFADGLEELSWSYRPVREAGTELPNAFRELSRIVQPEKTLLISDGSVGDHLASLMASDQITGAIDTLWCHDMHSDPGNLAQDFMIDLARRKRGQMRRYSFSEGGAALRRYMIESAPKPYTTHAGWKSPHIGIDAQTQRKAPMAKDFWGRAPRIDVQQPDRNEIYVEHGTDVYHQQVFNHHWLDPQHIENGGPEPVTIGTRPTDMRIIESAGPQRTMVAAKKPGFIGGLFSSSSSSSRQQQALPAPQPEYRGEMRSASMPQHTALPAPQRQAAPQPRARALPAPQGRPAPPQPPLQIEHQPQGLLQAIIFGPNKQKVR